jgi:hypothetical protein
MLKTKYKMLKKVTGDSGGTGDEKIVYLKKSMSTDITDLG